jgi:hypothetical protein
MPSSSPLHLPQSGRKYLAVALLAVLLAVAAYGAATLTIAGPTQDEPEQQAKDVQVLRLTLRPDGFERSELRLLSGRYLFVVKNRTGLDQYALRLNREGHGIQSEAHPQRHQREWRELINLTPGEYVLTESTHPEWACRLTITPR